MTKIEKYETQRTIWCVIIILLTTIISTAHIIFTIDTTIVTLIGSIVIPILGCILIEIMFNVLDTKIGNYIDINGKDISYECSNL